MAVTGPEGRWVYVNRSLAALTGYPRKELLQLSFQGLTHPDDLAGDAECMEALRTGAIQSFEMRKRFIRADGTETWIELWVSTVHDDSGGAGIAGYLSQMRDAGERIAIEDELAVAEARFRRMFEDSPIGIVTATTDRRFVSVNDAFCQLVGRSRGDLVGSPIGDITHPDDRLQDEVTHLALGDGDRSVTREKRYLRPDGSIVWASVVTAHLATTGDEVFFAQIVDITERKRLVAALEEEAATDQLTGLANRRRFESALAQHAAACARYGARGAVLMIDLDGFKHVNDSCGHLDGDAALVTAARIVRDAVRTSDLAARLGGDEFAVLVPEGDAESAALLGERILRSLVVPTATGPVRASVGVAAFQDGDDETGVSTLVRADEALYDAKRRGGARCSTASTGHLAV